MFPVEGGYLRSGSSPPIRPPAVWLLPWLLSAKSLASGLLRFCHPLTSASGSRRMGHRNFDDPLPCSRSSLLLPLMSHPLLLQHPLHGYQDLMKQSRGCLF
ncbi:PREDICTED: uncharacterized protein LOC105557320 [Vollenhovia emeryi]|uniref:uncharacterized protein LOC105557320 n=1 Tax=Vollenhovia emeryi TaxID=411798 RepID=UPI0005F51B66|nr:PREDICTED: uncharacterized protein LOC105557320 [Vollenhovia emeryi]XP_011859920.1 PREDICTED: uncharacterized protein LOC105557320 [Vollenhovia emeryi]